MKTNVSVVGFEPTSTNTSVLETDPLDRSGKLTTYKKYGYIVRGSNPRLRRDQILSLAH